MQSDAYVELADALAEHYPTESDRPVLVGPDTGRGGDPTPSQPQVWLESFLGGQGSKDLYAVTNHNYVQINSTNYNEPATLAYPDMDWFGPTIERGAPLAQLWAGENGPHNGGDDGTCGDGSVCGTYASSMWYADEMGARARAGFAQFQRQDLVGGRYGLVLTPHDSEALSATDAVTLTADFWVAFLWKRVMGGDVFRATLSDHHEGTLKAYLHRGAAPSPWAAEGSWGIVLINLSSAAARRVSIGDASASKGTAQSWTLTAGADGPLGIPVLMNGQAVPATISGSGTIEEIPVAAHTWDLGEAGAALTLPPESITFVSF